MNKLWIVTFETFLRQVKSWSFVTLILGPFIMFAIMVGSGYLGASSVSDNGIAVISDNQQLRTSFIKANKDDVKKSVISEKTAQKKMKKPSSLIVDYLNNILALDFKSIR